ncbi:MAG: SRPBCC family protein [Bradymonadaceae bacterium]
MTKSKETSISFSHQERVNAPVEEAFAFGLDPDNWTRHFPGVSEYEILEENDDDMRLRIPYRLLWFNIVFEIELRVVDPDSHIAVEAESEWMLSEGHYYYTEIEEGTLIEAKGEYRFGDSILARLLEPLLSVAQERKIKKAMQKEKKLIEAESND